MRIIPFLREERSKLLATLVVAGFFFYFWVEGPLQQIEALVNLEQEETEYSRPQLVGNQKSKHNYNTIEDAETTGFGHGLMLNKKGERNTSGILVDEKSNAQESAGFSKKLLQHAQQLSAKKMKFVVHASHNLYYVTSEDNSLIYLESQGVVHGIHGYAGPVNVGVFIRADGTIHSTHHISSKETESYLRKIENAGYYQQFTSLPLKGTHDIDAISGATLTSEAMAETASELIQHAIPEPLINLTEVDEMHPFNATASLTWWWMVHISVIGLMFLYGFQKKIKKTKKGIIVLSLLSVVYIGFFLNNSFTYISFIHPFVGTSVSSLVGLYALFSLLGAIWGKNTYCKYVCPFGNAQRLLIKITPKQATAKFPISNRWIGRIRMAIALILILGIMLGLRGWSNYELFPDLFGLEVKSLWFIAAFFMVGFSIRYPLIWCRLLCPTGSILDIISDLSNEKPILWKRKRAA